MVWCVTGAAVAIVVYAAAADVALALLNRGEIRKLSEDGVRRAAVVERLLADPGQLFLVTMLLRTLGLAAAGMGVALLLPADTVVGATVLAIACVWLALAAVQVGGTRPGSVPRPGGGVAFGAVFAGGIHGVMAGDGRVAVAGPVSWRRGGSGGGECFVDGRWVAPVARSRRQEVVHESESR